MNGGEQLLRSGEGESSAPRHLPFAARESSDSRATFQTPATQTAALWCEHVLGAPDFDSHREASAVFCYDDHGRLLSHTVLPYGDVLCVPSPLYAIFRAPLLAGSERIVIAHSHPGGADITPSASDLNHCHGCLVASRLLKIDLLDYLVIGERGDFRSFREDGLFDIERRVTDERNEPDMEALRCHAATAIFEPAPEMVGLVSDAAFRAGVPMHQFVFGLVREFVQRHVRGEVGSDPKLCLASHLLRMEAPHGQRLPLSYALRAEDAGQSFHDFVWHHALELLRRDIAEGDTRAARVLRENSNSFLRSSR